MQPVNVVAEVHFQHNGTALKPSFFFGFFCYFIFLVPINNHFGIYIYSLYPAKNKMAKNSQKLPKLPKIF
jgi:hypothetical protein